MKCINCPASHETHYAESYEVDWYCLAGVLDDDRQEFKDGELGCKLHKSTIQKRVKINEEIQMKDYEDFVNWYVRQSENTSP